MTTNDIISHRLGATAFYKSLPVVSITEAAKEPLKLADLQQIATRVKLPSGNFSDYCVGVCFACIQDLLSKFARKTKPEFRETEYIALQMSNKFAYWSVLDLPSFVDMAVGARIPSVKFGLIEYEMTVLDIPGILGKVESYDKMRPNKEALQGNSPMKAQALQPIQKEHYHQLLDGTPYDFSVPYEDYVQGYCAKNGDPRVNAERYWRTKPQATDEDWQRFWARFSQKIHGKPIVQSVNEVLGL